MRRTASGCGRIAARGSSRRRRTCADAPGPGEDVAEGGERRRSGEREREEDGHRIAVHGPVEALPPVHVHAGARVDPGLERGERRERAAAEQEAVQAEAGQREPGSRAGRELERMTLAHAQRGEPEHAEREQRGRAQRDDGDHREAGAAELARERRRRGRVGQCPAAEKHEDESQEQPRSMLAPSHLHVQRKRRGQQLAPVGDLEEQSPAPGRREQDAELEAAGLRAAPRRGRRSEAGRAGRVAAADVRVEVVERAVAEEDRVGQRAVERRELDGFALRHRSRRRPSMPVPRGAAPAAS